METQQPNDADVRGKAEKSSAFARLRGDYVIQAELLSQDVLAYKTQDL